MKGKRITAMIMIIILILIFLTGCVTFSKVKKEAKLRFSGYEEMASSVQASYG